MGAMPSIVPHSCSTLIRLMKELKQHSHGIAWPTTHAILILYKKHPAIDGSFVQIQILAPLLLRAWNDELRQEQGHPM